MKKIFISDQEHARDNPQYFYPYIVIARKDIPDTETDEVSDVVLDGTDTEILDVFKRAKKSYLPNSIDFLADVDTISKVFSAGREQYQPTPERIPTIEDNYITGDDLSTNVSSPTTDADFDIEQEEEISMSEQIQILQPLLENKKRYWGCAKKTACSNATLLRVCFALCFQNARLYLPSAPK